MATHSNILAWGIPWTEEPGGLQSMGLKESDTTERISLSVENTEDYTPTFKSIDGLMRMRLYHNPAHYN